ncbi:putative L-aspartate dehydrogenase [Stegodyphus dumicola]|uniref:putative L-aspartate dehydrogenase n=1 Tax=Stegodyphus dumicola TaxID=202533 RepID=UPI0015A921C0|nr:putative L-aspartate dehydrogenase [Stegodyphus dumicola]
MAYKVGIIGFGNLGKFLVSSIAADPNYEIAFVWNRTKSVICGVVETSLILDDLKDFASRKPDIIVEVAHPSITKSFGKEFLSYCDYMLCDEDLLRDLEEAAIHHGLYIPSGAFWGGEDVRKMSDARKLRALKVTMKKHPLSLKVEGYLKLLNDEVKDKAVTLYEGCVRDVCSLAPHNTNTMAAAAVAAPSLGFDGVTGCLISDPNLDKYHIVEIEAFGFPNKDGSYFHVHTIRKNPAVVGEVTGEATYTAYLGSLKRAKGKGPGVHLC